jgi:hypothetical protein
MARAGRILAEPDGESALRRRKRATAVGPRNLTGARRQPDNRVQSIREMIAFEKATGVARNEAYAGKSLLLDRRSGAVRDARQTSSEPLRPSLYDPALL